MAVQLPPRPIHPRHGWKAPLMGRARRNPHHPRPTDTCSNKKPSSRLPPCAVPRSCGSDQYRRAVLPSGVEYVKESSRNVSDGQDEVVAYEVAPRSTDVS